MTTKNGVNVEQLDEAIETISEESSAGQFRFYAETEFETGDARSVPAPNARRPRWCRRRYPHGDAVSPVLGLVE
jgi:hypothetical protein